MELKFESYKMMDEQLKDAMSIIDVMAYTIGADNNDAVSRDSISRSLYCAHEQLEGVFEGLNEAYQANRKKIDAQIEAQKERRSHS